MQIALGRIRRGPEREPIILPVVEIGGGIAGNACDIDACAAPGFVAIRKDSMTGFNLAVPIINSLVKQNPAAVRVDGMTVCILP